MANDEFPEHTFIPHSDGERTLFAITEPIIPEESGYRYGERFTGGDSFDFYQCSSDGPVLEAANETFLERAEISRDLHGLMDARERAKLMEDYKMADLTLAAYLKFDRELRAHLGTEMLTGEIDRIAERMCDEAAKAGFSDAEQTVFVIATDRIAACFKQEFSESSDASGTSASG